MIFYQNGSYSSLILIFILMGMTGCQRGDQLLSPGSIDVIPIPDPCDLAPDTVYPPGYPSTFFDLLPGVLMVPLIATPPIGVTCLPGGYICEPPLPEGLFISETTGTINGTPYYGNSVTQHEVTALFPLNSASVQLTIIVQPGIPLFEYPLSEVTLDPDEVLLMSPLILPGSGEIKSWGAFAPEAPPGSIDLDEASGTLSLTGLGSFSLRIYGLNSQGEHFFDIEVILDADDSN